MFGTVSQKVITKCDGIITNCDSLVYHKVRHLFITKCDTVYYKLRQVLQSAMAYFSARSQDKKAVFFPRRYLLKSR